MNSKFINIKKIFISILVIFIYFLISKSVQAAGSVSLSANKSSVNVGDTFNISVNLSNANIATLTARVGFDTQKIEYVSGPNNSNASGGRAIYTWTDPTGGNSPLTGGTVATFTFRAKAEGNAVFSVSGDFFTPDETSANPAFSGVTVNVKKVETSTGGGTTEGGTTGGETTGGGTTGGGTTEGGTTEGGTTGGGTTEGGTTGGGATGGGTTGGNVPSDTAGNNKNASSNNNLKSLQLDVEGITPVFNKNTTQYYIVISNNISNINITAIPEDSKAKVQINGNSNIQEGNSKIKIIVTAENGNQKNYIINVTKTNNPELSNSNLENLAIENATLIPEFSPDITDYSTEVFGDINSLNILAIPQIEGANVTIEGNENLKYGDNYIKINVLAKDGATSKIYNISVQKKEITEEQISEENINNANINEENDNNNNNDNESTMEKLKKNKIKQNTIIYIGIGVILIIIIIGVIIKLKRRKKKQ